MWVVQQVFNEGYTTVSVAYHNYTLVNTDFVLQNAVFRQNEEIEVSHLQVELVTVLTSYIGSQHLFFVHIISLMVPLTQEEWEGALAQEFKL
jgi:hypothetical protein